MSSPNPSPTLLEDLVVANHILFEQGVVDAFGHISVRHETQPDRFLLARNMAPGSVTADGPQGLSGTVHPRRNLPPPAGCRFDRT
jgi:hypothetical protein